MKVQWATVIQDVAITIIFRKSQKCFYDPKIATKEIVDEVYAMAS
jgi:hypothetical protein